MEKFRIEYQEFLLRFVRTENNLIAFLGPSNCVNTQYAALSGAMILRLYFYWKFIEGRMKD